MIVRNSTPNDLPSIMRIYDIARTYMRNNGNATQWDDNYPNKEIVQKDIDEFNSYVILVDDKIVGTFSFILGPEETYQVIENGNWRYDYPYGTIHRLASDGSTKGIAKICFDYCSDIISYIRIDTHNDNLTMKHSILKFGFKECGIIYVRDKSKRIAFDYLSTTNK